MISLYKISNALEDVNGYWLVNTDTSQAQHLDSTEPEKVWDNFYDFIKCTSIVAESREATCIPSEIKIGIY